MGWVNTKKKLAFRNCISWRIYRPVQRENIPDLWISHYQKIWKVKMGYLNLDRGVHWTGQLGQGLFSLTHLTINPYIGLPPAHRPEILSKAWPVKLFGPKIRFGSSHIFQLTEWNLNQAAVTLKVSNLAVKLTSIDPKRATLPINEWRIDLKFWNHVITIYG